MDVGVKIKFGDGVAEVTGPMKAGVEVPTSIRSGSMMGREK